MTELTRLLSKAGDGIRLSGTWTATGAQCSACLRHGLEGIVSKRRDALYRSGRSPHWIKVKNPHAPAATRIFE